MICTFRNRVAPVGSYHSLIKSKMCNWILTIPYKSELPQLSPCYPYQVHVTPKVCTTSIKSVLTPISPYYHHQIRTDPIKSVLTPPSPYYPHKVRPNTHNKMFPPEKKNASESPENLYAPESPSISSYSLWTLYSVSTVLAFLTNIKCRRSKAMGRLDTLYSLFLFD